MKISPETKKILIYGIVSVVGGVTVLWLWNRYESNNTNGSGSDAANAQAQADAAAQQAEQDQYQLAELGAVASIGGNAGVSDVSATELPQDDFAAEVASILSSTGITPSTVATQPTNAAPSATQTTPPTTVTNRNAPVIVHVGPGSVLNPESESVVQ